MRVFIFLYCRRFVLVARIKYYFFLSFEGRESALVFMATQMSRERAGRDALAPPPPPPPSGLPSTTLPTSLSPRGPPLPPLSTTPSPNTFHPSHVPHSTPSRSATHGLLISPASYLHNPRNPTPPPTTSFVLPSLQGPPLPPRTLLTSLLASTPIVFRRDLKPSPDEEKNPKQS